MIARSELKNNSLKKLQSAEVLFKARCYDDCIYLAGYAIELGLKYKFCETLNINFPDDLKDVKLRTHNLKELLYISGKEAALKLDPDWAVITNTINWSEQLRYKSGATKINAKKMIDSCQNLLFTLKIA